MILKARDIHKSFGSLEVLKGVDFEAEKGDVIAIVVLREREKPLSSRYLALF